MAMKGLVTIVIEFLIPFICIVGIKNVKGSYMQNVFLDNKKVDGSDIEYAVSVIQNGLIEATLVGMGVTVLTTIVLLFFMHRCQPIAPDVAQKYTKRFRISFLVALVIQLATFSIVIVLNGYFNTIGTIASFIAALLLFSLPFFAGVQLFSPIYYKPLFPMPRF